jgi:four helix bundle protein
MGRCYGDVVVWQKAMELVTNIYRETATFPHSEMYGLTSQVRRAAVSVPSNIVEGQGRLSEKEFRHFLRFGQRFANGSRTQLRIAENLGYIQHEQSVKLEQSVSAVGKILN